MDAIVLSPGSAEHPARRLRLWLEMLALFVGVPLAMVAFFGSYPLFGALMALAGVALALLTVTPGFSFRELVTGGLLRHWKLLLGFAAVALAASLAVASLLVPNALFGFPRYAPERWLLVMALYPLLSVLPQELIYRPLFFRRYGGLFPGPQSALAANSVAFGLGHLFYMNPVTILMTVGAGAVFGWAYLRTGSFLLAVALHALAGQIVFTVGLGRFFYHGAVAQ